MEDSSMQSNNERNLGSPYDWLNRARSNLIRAKQPKPDKVYWEDLCFDAQQAAEKAIKALLMFHKIPLGLAIQTHFAFLGLIKDVDGRSKLMDRLVPVAN